MAMNHVVTQNTAQIASNANHEHAVVAAMFRALAEPARLSIIHCLADAPHRVGEIATHVGLAQSTVSAHLAILRDAGLVAAEAQGRATEYRLSNPYLDHVLEAAERLVQGYEHDAQQHSPLTGANR